MNSSLTDSPEAGLRLAGTLFALFAALHVVRLIGRVDVVVGRHHVPMMSSVAAATVGALAGAWFWKLSQQEH